jgi:membrane-bound lytic murein transglycosylase MltF
VAALKGHLTMTLQSQQSDIRRGILALLIATAVGACSNQPPQQAAPATASPAATDAPIPNTASPFDGLPDSVRAALDKPFTGDFNEMLKRRLIRVGVTFNRTHYFIDAGQERGITYEALKSFENDLNTDLKTGNLKVHVVLLPMSRDQLYPALATGKIDMVAAMVTVRPALEKLVLFSEPTRRNVSQVVVTGPGAPAIATADDLAGQDVFVRRTSPYFETLTRLNVDLIKRGKPAIVIDEAPDALEDDDVLEMVNAGLAPITVVDDYLADFWKQIFTNTNVHSNVALRTGGVLAVAFRKESPKLCDVVNQWIRTHQKGDAFRNTLERRYLQNVKYAKSAAAEGERRKLAAVIELFRKYGAEYNVD